MQVRSTFCDTGSGVSGLTRSPGAELALALTLALAALPAWTAGAPPPTPPRATTPTVRGTLPAPTGTVNGRTTVYRWTDAAGVRHYSSEPPEPDAQPAALPPLQVYRADTPGPVLPASAPAQDTLPVQPATARLTAPTEGQVFLTGSAMAVAVEVSPGLPKTPGGVVFELDGRPLTREPQPDRMTLAAPAPGEHRLVARVVDAQGRTAGASTPVRFVVQAVPVEAIDAFLKGPGGN